MKVLYDFRQDRERIRDCQNATVNTNAGLKPTHGLIGSAEWWSLIDVGALPLRIIEGYIVELHGGPMGDWPSVRVKDTKGKIRSWTVYAAIPVAYVGKRIVIEYVEQEAKNPPYPGYVSEVLLRMLVDDT